jgi:hypothetical protein
MIRSAVVLATVLAANAPAFAADECDPYKGERSLYRKGRIELSFGNGPAAKTSTGLIFESRYFFSKTGYASADDRLKFLANAPDGSYADLAEGGDKPDSLIISEAKPAHLNGLWHFVRCEKGQPAPEHNCDVSVYRKGKVELFLRDNHKLESVPLARTSTGLVFSDVGTIGTGIPGSVYYNGDGETSFALADPEGALPDTLNIYSSKLDYMNGRWRFVRCKHPADPENPLADHPS